MQGSDKLSAEEKVPKKFHSHREWAGHMSVLYLLYQLVENYADNLELLRNVDWVVVPVVNPDGYVYTHTNVGSNRF